MKKKYIKPETQILHVKLEPMLDTSQVTTGSIGVAGTITETGNVFTGGVVDGTADSWSSDGLTTSKRGGFFDDDDEY